jgi:type VI secretion system protein ImpM
MTPGCYGKIPSTGDFVTRRVAPSFSEAWDRWLQAALRASRERLGAEWHDAYLCMPAWRFVLAPGALTPGAWAGVMVPSVDAVGRVFPLTAVAALPLASLDPVAPLFSAAPWFDAIEAVALRAIAPDTNAADIDSELKRHPFPAESLERGSRRGVAAASREAMLSIPLSPRMPGERAPAGLPAQGEPCSAWLAEESEVLGRSLLFCSPLPGAGPYCALMDGRWLEHGWSRRDLEPERA